LIKNTSQERELFWIVDSISFAHRAAPLPIIALQLRTLTRGLAAVGPKGDGPAAYIGEDAIQSSTDAVVQHNGSGPRNTDAGTEMVTMRWGRPPPLCQIKAPPVSRMAAMELNTTAILTLAG